jgi:hypothetical protein
MEGTALLHAGRFSAADLDVNRSGWMTLRQRLKVLRGTMAVLILAAIGLVISVAIGPNLVGAFQEDLILGVVVTLFFLMCLLMGVGCAIAALADTLDVVLGRAGSATGPLKLHTENVTTNALARPLPSSYTYPGQFTYHLEVGRHDFSIGHDLFDALEAERGYVRVYYAAHSDELLSLELLEPGEAH